MCVCVRGAAATNYLVSVLSSLEREGMNGTAEITQKIGNKLIEMEEGQRWR